jgi:hypothetical protein
VVVNLAASTMPTVLSWTSAGPPGAEILLILVDTGIGEVKCWADDTAGTLTVPPQLLSTNFHVNDTGYLNIGRIVVTHPSTNADVELVAFSTTVWSVIYMQ